MSAYLVDDAVVDFILSGWMRLEGAGYPSAWVCDKSVAGEFNKVGGDLDRLEKIGQMMIDENYASLAARYGGNDAPHKYVFRKHRAAYSMDLVPMVAQLGMSMACLEYQSCEHKGWEASIANQVLAVIRKRALEGLDVDDKAKWGAPAHSSPDGEFLPERKLVRIA